MLKLIPIIGAMISVQMGAALGKQLFPTIGPVWTTFLRTSLAALVLFVLFRPWRIRINRYIFFYGLSLGLMNLLFYLSIQRISLGIAVACEFSGPLILAVTLSRRGTDFLWVALAFIGIALLSPLSPDPVDLDGVMYALLAGACWAGYIIFGRWTKEQSGPVVAMGMGVAALTTLPFALFSGPLKMQTSLWPMAFAVAVLSSAIPYSLEMIMLQKISAKNFGILMSLEPALAVVSGFVFLHEALNPMQILAIGSVVIASYGSTISSRAQSG